MADDGEAPRPFRITRAPMDGAPGVALSGEIDLACVPAMTEALDAAIRDSEGAFVLDLSDVEFLDSSGLSGLMRARALLARDERALAVVSPPGPVRRLFAMAGVADLLILFDARDDARAALVPP
jgi:anti-sigma B factor antagonist